MDIEKARVKAARQGKRIYMSDRPCKRHGKVSRYVSMGACIECQKAASKERAAKIREQLQAVKDGI